MKANEAPEKIYLNQEDGLIWHCRSYKDDVEYIRADAFIEKAEEYLKTQFIKDVSVLAGGVVDINFSIAIKNFVNYMKGE